MKAFVYIGSIALMLSGAHAHADWSGSAEAGGVSARGNTNTNTANAKLDLTDQLEFWKHNFAGAGLYGSNSTATTAKRWDARWQSDYRITDPLYWFGGLRYERDYFGSFSYQASATTGLGYKFIDNDRTKLSAQAGTGIKRSREQTLVENEDDEVVDRIQGDVAERVLFSFGSSFEHALTDTTKVLNKLLVESASDNTFIQNDLALQVAINSSLSLSAGYGIRENTSPPPGSVRTDQITTLNLVYKLH